MKHTAQASLENQSKRRRVLRLTKIIVVVIVSAALLYHASILLRVVRLRHTNPETTAFIEQRDGEARARGSTPERQQIWIPYEQISPHLLRAVTVGEDPNFFSHSGLDWSAIWFAIKTNLRSKHIVLGASTINQQLAKNLFFSSSKSFVRKAHEGLVALEMERILGKRRVLELYLNVIEWGDGIYGVEAAARHYFNTSALSLDEEQAAFLTALIPNPRSTFNPTMNPERVNYRRDIILAFMSDEPTPEEVLRGLAIKSVMPDFPAQAYEAGAEGLAVARLQIDEQGNVTRVDALAAPHPSIKEALVAALSRWKFRPAEVNNRPAATSGKLRFHYAIQNGAGVVRNPTPR